MLGRSGSVIARHSLSLPHHSYLCCRRPVAIARVYDDRGNDDAGDCGGDEIKRCLAIGAQAIEAHQDFAGGLPVPWKPWYEASAFQRPHVRPAHPQPAPVKSLSPGSVLYATQHWIERTYHRCRLHVMHAF